MSIISDFIFFSIIGFIGEMIYCGLHKRKSGKALRGPWCPLYGLGGLTIFYVVNIFSQNFILIYTFGVIFASIVEYLTSYILELIFHTRWWDYKEKRFNINGRICLENSLLFGVLALVLFYIYIPIKDKIMSIINYKTYAIIVIVLSIIIIIDGVITVLEAIELKRRLDLIEEHNNINKETLKSKLSKLKTNLNPNRLLRIFTPDNNEKNKLLQKYYKIKSNFKRKK